MQSVCVPELELASALQSLFSRPPHAILLWVSSTPLTSPGPPITIPKMWLEGHFPQAFSFFLRTLDTPKDSEAQVCVLCQGSASPWWKTPCFRWQLCYMVGAPGAWVNGLKSSINCCIWWLVGGCGLLSLSGFCSLF